jgi:phosphohistidine phosphatase
MGVYMEKQKLVPDLALVSTARRAQETWTRASGALRAAVPVANTRDIYEAESSRILDVIRETGPEITTLIVVGHNPGLEDLARKLMKDAGGDAGTRMREKFPTAAMAILSFEADSWKDIAPQAGSLDRFVTPKSLR